MRAAGKVRNEIAAKRQLPNADWSRKKMPTADTIASTMKWFRAVFGTA